MSGAQNGKYRTSKKESLLGTTATTVVCTTTTVCTAIDTNNSVDYSVYTERLNLLVDRKKKHADHFSLAHTFEKEALQTWCWSDFLMPSVQRRRPRCFRHPRLIHDVLGREEGMECLCRAGFDTTTCNPNKTKRSKKQRQEKCGLSCWEEKHMSVHHLM